MNGTYTIVAAVVGIDGSGKSSAFRGALELLAERVDVVAIGDEYLAGAPGMPVHARTDLRWQRTAGCIARRAKRNVVMVTYEGEDHGLRREENQRDYQRRILAWFGHYLKGEPAERWITEGKSALERERELKRLEGGR